MFIWEMSTGLHLKFVLCNCDKKIKIYSLHWIRAKSEYEKEADFAH